MKLSFGLVVATQLLAVLALPKNGKNKGTTTTTSAAAATSTAAAAEEGKENEVEQTGQFGVAVNVGGGNIKTDTLFPPGTNGALEVELQGQDAVAITVTENKTPAAPPAGFTALEAVSYVVALEGATNFTLQKIDYVRNANSALDISKGVLGRLCTETKTFAIVADTEFEADEFELTTPVDSIAGEFALFLPDAAAATAGGTTTGGATTGATQPTAAEVLQQLLDLLGKAGKV